REGGPPGPHRAQPAYRRDRQGEEELRAEVQGRPGLQGRRQRREEGPGGGQAGREGGREEGGPGQGRGEEGGSGEEGGHQGGREGPREEGLHGQAEHRQQDRREEDDRQAEVIGSDITKAATGIGGRLRRAVFVPMARRRRVRAACGAARPGLRQRQGDQRQ